MLSKKTGKWMIGYGIFLAVCGVAGFLSNPEGAKTALLSGGVFGGLSVVAGILMGMKVPLTALGSLGLVSMLALVFTWRASVGWLEVLAGQSEKLFAASLISLMLVGSCVMIVMVSKYLFASRTRPDL